MALSTPRCAFIVMPLALLASGCEFFGKQTPSAANPAAAVASSLEPLPAAYQGSWSYIDVGSSGTSTPSSVFYTAFSFSSTNSSHFVYQDLLMGGALIDLVGVAAFDTKLSAIVMGLISGTDPTGSFIGNTLQLSSPQVSGASLTYTTSSGTRTLYAAPALTVQPPAGVWNFSIPNLDFAVIAPSGYAVLQMRDNTNAPVLVDAIANAGTDGSLTFQCFAVQPENRIGDLVFSSYTVMPNGDLSLVDANGTHTGTRL